MKKKTDYFGTFIRVAEIAKQQADCLKEVVDNYSLDKIPDEIHNMHELERSADAIRHTLLDQLMHDFIPPFEQSDIIELVERLDDLCDTIDDVVMKFYMYNITVMRNDASNFCDGLIACVGELVNLFSQFESYKNPKKLFENINHVNDIEELGDAYYFDSTHQLYVDPNALDREGWTLLYAGLEDCYDACEEITEIVRNIIVKNS